MDVRSNYPLSAHPGIHGSIPIVGSMDRLLLSPSKGILRNEEKFGTSRAKRGSGAPSAVDKPTRPCSSPHRPHRAERNIRRERSRLPPRREEVIVLLIRGSNLGPSKGFDKGPRSTESGIINGTLEARTLEETNRLCSRPGKVPRSRDPSRGSIEPSTSIERGQVLSSILSRKAFMDVSCDHEPTLIERGMDVHSNHPLPAQPGIRGSIPPREARVASSSAPSNREREARRKLEIPPTSGAVDEPTPKEAVNALLIRLRPWESLGGYTRGCASAPPRILGTHEEIKASKASTNSSLRRMKTSFLRRLGGYCPKLLGIKAHDDIDLAQQPSKGPPSLRVLGPIQLEVNDHPRADGFRLDRGSAASTPTLERMVSVSIEARRPRPSPSSGVSVSIEARRPRPSPSSGVSVSIEARRPRPSPSSGVSVSFEARRPRPSPSSGVSVSLRPLPSRGCFPSRSRVGELELAIQARARLDGNSAQPTAVHQSRHDADMTLSAMLHARPNPASSTATSKEATEARIGPVRKLPTLDAVNCHEKEGRYVSPCHVVSGVGRRDSRSRTVRGMDEHLGLRRLSPSPTLLVNPYYKQHVTRCIAPLLDVRPRGRNQDKTSEWLAPQSLGSTAQEHHFSFITDVLGVQLTSSMAAFCWRTGTAPRVVSMMHDFLGGGIFNADGESWRAQRKVASHEFNTRSLRVFVARCVHDELHGRLLPLLRRRATASGASLDLQDVLERFGFDNICRVAFDHDPRQLSVDGDGDDAGTASNAGSSSFADAFRDASYLSVGRFRYAIPGFWKVKKALNVGSERRLRESVATVHGFADRIIQSRREEMQRDGFEKHDLLSRFMASHQGESSKEALRDVVTSFLLAGRESTSSALTWFFWLLSSRPVVQRRIRDEIAAVRARHPRGDDVMGFDVDELREMHYVHAAITESMRLYPPVPANSLHVQADDVLPDGTAVKAGWSVGYNSYAMGRMVSVWGDDALEYRPERWLSPDDGTFQPGSPFRFVAFHAGPRLCLGKEMAYIQMKSVVASVLEDLDVVVDGAYRPRQLPSLTLRMAGGLPVTVKPRRD
ncbi:hypothetical protein HU200_025373 [Digitaria exilis]|uniref:Cytochrome P450 n=1 Tax=Digitaria exilis TaxID=1010633 RepID=A0A835C2Z9_9POAL|nr:hypothetical protein HU200_025373 [Digitaria exilis]